MSHLNWISLCNLCVLYVSVVNHLVGKITTESQRKQWLHREEAQTKTPPNQISRIKDETRASTSVVHA